MKKFYSAPTLLLFLLISIFIAHCQKAKETLARNYVIKVMTEGRWIVNKFTINDIDSTASFSPYEFQFVGNGTVYAITASGETPGTWEGNAQNLTITSNFPSSNSTLRLVSDTFKIINNTPSLVEARPVNANKNVYLKLVKK